jgi:hypothetical protein
MAVPVQTSTYNPPYHTMLGANVDAGNFDIVLSSSQCNLEKGFSIQTGTLTAMNVTVSDSVDGSVFVDNTEDYAGPGITVLASDKVYKCDLKSPVKAIRIRAARSNALNAVDLKVLAPNR